MQADLTRFLDGRPIAARQVSSLTRLRLWASRNRGVATLAFILLATSVAVLIVASIAAINFRNMAKEYSATESSCQRCD